MLCYAHTVHINIFSQSNVKGSYSVTQQEHSSKSMPPNKPGAAYTMKYFLHATNCYLWGHLNKEKTFTRCYHTKTGKSARRP